VAPLVTSPPARRSRTAALPLPPAKSYVEPIMNCGSCGVQNVDYATTCYSCGGAIGSTFGKVSAASAPHSAGSLAQVQVRVQARKLSALPTIVLILIGLAIVPRIFRGLESWLDRAVTPPAEEQAAAPVEEAAPAPPSEPSFGDASESSLAPEERDGFLLSAFVWVYPDERPDRKLRFGDVIRGQSEIKGFEISGDNRINVTVAFAFRDPNGVPVEPIKPNQLDQPSQSDTLYSSFEYTIPEAGPVGTYDLELGIADAVSGRSTVFHRTVEAVAD